MLNKNQSNRWSSWKYLLIVPALAAFMFYFQVKVIAQEKKAEVNIPTAISNENVTVVIDKNTTDDELKAEVKRVKEAHAVTLKFSKVKRNANGEIIAIKAEFKDKKSDKKGVYQISGDEPIKPLRFFKNDNGAIGFGSPRNIHIFNKSDAVADADLEAPEVPESPEDMEAPEAPEPPEPPVFDKNNVTVHTGKNGQITVHVNGEDIDIDTDAILADAHQALAGLDDIDVHLNSRELNKIAREALKEVREEMRKARPELERARREMRNARPELERAAREIERSKPEIEQAKREIEQAREEIRQAKIEIEQQRVEIEKSKAASKK